jgi:hypothetical protein
VNSYEIEPGRDTRILGPDSGGLQANIWKGSVGGVVSIIQKSTGASELYDTCTSTSPA